MTEQSPGYWHNPVTPIHDVFWQKKREEISIFEKQIADLKKQEEQAHLDAIRAIVREEVRKALQEMKPPQTPHEAWVNWQEMED